MGVFGSVNDLCGLFCMCTLMDSIILNMSEHVFIWSSLDCLEYLWVNLVKIHFSPVLFCFNSLKTKLLLAVPPKWPKPHNESLPGTKLQIRCCRFASLAGLTLLQVRFLWWKKYIVFVFKDLIQTRTITVFMWCEMYQLGQGFATLHNRRATWSSSLETKIQQKMQSLTSHKYTLFMYLWLLSHSF